MFLLQFLALGAVTLKNQCSVFFPGDSKWYPAWDRPACDEYCISVVVLRLFFLILTIPAAWILPKYWSIAPASE